MNLKGHVWAHLLGVQHLSLANPHPQVGLSQSCFPPLPQITSCGSPWLNMRPGPLQTLPISSHDIPPLHNSEYEFMRYYNVWYFIHRSNIRGQYRLNPNKSWQIVWVDKNAEEISSVVKSSRSVRCQLRCLQRKQQCRAIELWSSSFLSLQIDIHEIGEMTVGFGKWHWPGVEKGKRTWINKLEKLSISNGYHLAPSDYQMIITCQQVIL